MPLILTMTPMTASQGRGTQGRSPASGGGERQIRTLAAGTLSIGRAPGNDWVLADPDQHLSRTHCMIAFEAGRYVLTDLSTNGLLINGAREPTTRNSRIVLTDGDTIQLGNYMLSVAEAEDAAQGSGASPFGASRFITPRDQIAGTADGGPLDVDPLEDPLGGGPDNAAPVGFSHPLPQAPPALRSKDPFDLAEDQRRQTGNLDDSGLDGGFGGGGRSPSPFGSPALGAPDEDLFRGHRPAEAWQGPAQSDRSPPGSHAYTAPRPVAPTDISNIDFDELLGDIMPTPASHPLAPPPSAATPPLPAGLADAFDDLLGDFPPSPTAPAPIVPPPSMPAGADPFLAADPAARAVPPTPSAPPHAIDAPAGETPAPISGQTAAQTAAQTSAAAAPTGGQEARALLTAFAEGAGLPHLTLGAQDPQATMRALGALFAAFTAGTRDVLVSRAEIKHELRVEQTMIRSRDNNALKFSVSSQEALAALLQPDRPGYKPPLAAIEEAFNDIRSHEMAVMAGLQTALIALLRRFDPAVLESRLQRGVLDAVLPSARKARFWELFCATYKDIASEAQDDFQSIFGREFARAYDAQIRKL